MDQHHNASEAQYGTPTPQPPIGTPTVGTAPPLPHTGSTLPVVEVGIALGMLMTVVVLWVCGVRPYLGRRFEKKDGMGLS